MNYQYIDDLLIYLATTRTSFTDDDNELAAQVEVTFALSYNVGGVEPTEEDIHAFESSVILQLTPFVREFLASTTNRLGLAPFLLPLVRTPESASDAR